MKRLVSVLLCLTMMLVLLAGCSKSGEDKTDETVLPGIPKTIEEDSTWFDSKRLELDLSDLGDQVGFAPVYADSEDVYLCCVIFNYPKTREEFEESTTTFHVEILKYDYKTESVEWTKQIDDYHTIFKYDNELLLMTSVSDPVTNQNINALYKFDEATGTKGAEKDFALIDSLNNLPLGSEVGGIFSMDDKLIAYVNKSDPDGTFAPSIYVMDAQGNVTIKDLGEDSKKAGIKNMIDYYKLSETEIAVIGTDWTMDSESDQESGLVVDISNDTVRTLEANSPLLMQSTDKNQMWTWCGNGLISSNNTGIIKYDQTTDAVQTVLDFNTTNIDRYEFLGDMRTLYSDDTTYVMGGTAMLTADSGKFVIYTMEKTDKNPNAGKTVITVADTETSFSPEISRVIFEFNDKAEDVFVVMDDRYCLKNYLIEDEQIDYQADSEWNRILSARMTEALRMDILTGKGPDLILNASSYSQLDNGDVFVDLADRVDGLGLDLYDNVLDGFKTGDSLYQVPLTFQTSGMTIVSYGENSVDYSKFTDSAGLTFEEFDKYVKDECNGINPLTNRYSREEVFMLLFRWIEKELIKGDTFDASNDLFKAAAEYAAKLPENNSEIYNYENSYFSYSEWFSFPITELNGIPTQESRGPMASPGLSAGITTNCSNVDAAWEFIEYMLQKDGQQYLINPIRPFYGINRDAMTEIAYQYEKRMMTPDPSMYAFDIMEPDRQVGEMPPDPTDEEIRAKADEDLAKTDVFITSLSGVLKGNTEIETVVREEMSAYFAGDRPLDEIIPVLNDRVSTILQERGSN